MKTKHLTPAKAIHPGEILLDELEAREISEKEFAIKSGIQPDQNKPNSEVKMCQTRK